MTTSYTTLKNSARFWASSVILGLVIVLAACPSASNSGGGGNGGGDGGDGNGGGSTSAYTCTNGASADGSTDATDTEKCTSCNDGFKLQNEKCVATKYTCTNGTPEDGTPGGSVDVDKCTECNDGFMLQDTACVKMGEYFCQNGTPQEGSTGSTEAVHACVSCRNGYTKRGNNQCSRIEFICSHGTPTEGNPTSGNEDVESCKSCSSGYKHVNTQCNRIEFICTNGTPTEGNPTIGGNEDVESCQSCSSGYKILANNLCGRIKYVCSHGTPTDGNPTTGNEDVESCQSCSSGYKHVNNQCNRIEYVCSNGTPIKGNPTTGNEDVQNCQSCVIGYFLVGIMCSKDSDMDGDGIYNTVDSCPAGASAWTSTNVTDSDGDGCRDSALLSTTEINDTSSLTGGGDAVGLVNNDSFGASLASLGDLDGNGPGAVTLAVGAWGDDTGGWSRGAVYLLNLNSSGGILGAVEINDGSKLTDNTDAIALSNYDFFGASLASLGDLDGSGAGVVTLAVGATGKDTGGTNRGTVYLLNLNSSGGILGVTEINDGSTLTDNTDAITLSNNDYFGISLASLGDIDGTGGGAVTLAVAAHKDDNGGSARGAVHLINLNSSFKIVSATEINDSSKLTDGTDAITLNNADMFGSSLASLGDLDGMGGGVVTLAVGAWADDAGGSSANADLGAVHLINLNSSFGIVSTTEINDNSRRTNGEDAITLAGTDYFGASISLLGDLDGSGPGTTTIAVGANSDEKTGNGDVGAIHLINLNSSFQIVNAMEVNDHSRLANGGDAITTHYADMFGESVASLGDLDGAGSGVVTLAVGALWDNAGGHDRGAVHIINLDIIEEWD